MSYHRETIFYVYQELYLSNLKVMLRHLSFQWLHPDQIFENPNTIPWEYDPFLKQNKAEKLNLALSILQNGTYWPLVVTDGFYISEGCHRVQSIKMAVSRGLWPRDKRLLCLVYPESLSLMRRSWHRMTTDQLEGYTIKSSTMYLTDQMNTIFYLHTELTENHQVYADDIVSFYGIPVDNLFKMMDVYVTLPIFLRYGLFEHRRKEPVLPLGVVNDERLFFDWYSDV